MKINFKFLKYVAIIGNLLFILWITYNGIDEGFKGTIYQKLSYVLIIGLLLVNIFLLSRRNKN